MKRLVTIGLFLVLVSPYLFLFKEIQFTNINIPELLAAFKNTLIQSLLSCVFTMGFGFWAARGLCSLEKSKKLKYFEMACLVPSFLPALFFVAAVLQVVKYFPFGIIGITIIHTLMYAGLIGLFLQFIFINKFQKLSEQAYLDGATELQFLFYMFRNMYFELTMIFLFLFVQFFTSFSVPQLVGQQTLTIETLIYEKIRTSGALSEAMFISFLESIFVISLLLFYRAQKVSYNHSKDKVWLVGSRAGLVVIILPIVLFVWGSLSGSAIGVRQILEMNNSMPKMLPLVLKSVSISIFTGIVLTITLSLVAFTYYSKLFDRFLLSYVPLSTVLIALGFLLVHLNLGFIEPDIKVVTAMIILFLPVLYRLELKTKLQSLDSQVEVASLMGARRSLIFNQIVFPQVFPSILFLAGLGAFWTIGDFAITQIIYGKDVTLALYIQSLVGSYKLELANLLIFLLLFLGFLVFILFREMKYVVSQKN